MKAFRNISLALPILILLYTQALAIETPIGLPQTINGMEIGAVYLQGIEIEPKGIMKLRAESDIHLECDIRAAENNPNGFASGEWIPNLTIDYTLIKLDSGQKIEDVMMPMVASDGPHYGDNVKMLGAGKYKLIFKIDNPLKKGQFGRHTDKKSGVKDWFKPFQTEWEFNYFGAGKKGGY